MRLFFFLGVSFALAACQDSYASNSERDTHMGEVRAAPPPPPAPAASVTPSPAMAAPGTPTGSAPAASAANH
jgi:hypothetical protein